MAQADESRRGQVVRAQAEAAVGIHQLVDAIPDRPSGTEARQSLRCLEKSTR